MHVYALVPVLAGAEGTDAACLVSSVHLGAFFDVFNMLFNASSAGALPPAPTFREDTLVVRS